jgi:lipopolysaccharide export system protein LptA
MWQDAPPNRERVRRLVAALLLAGAAPVHALSTDSDQPIDIVADGAEHDDARRMTTYRGNVVIDQGSLHINADTVVVLFDAHDRVMKITSAGAPAHFRQLPDGETSYRKAWARQMEYFPQQDLINLSGEARYEKDGSQVQADRLVYDSLNARFRALSGAAAPSSGAGAPADGKKPERVRIQIKPKKKPTQ